MGVDRYACVAFGISFPKEVNPQEIMLMSDEQYENIFEEKYEYGLLSSSMYDSGSILYLKHTLIQIDQHDDNTIRSFEPLDHSNAFWNALGSHAETLQQRGYKPQWHLMFLIS